MHAYVIDTGVRFSHSTFGGRATSGYDAIDDDMDAEDCHGHGTHVAGTVGGTEYGVAKGVQIVGVRVLNCAGSGTTSQVVAGIDWVMANALKPAVANMSLGGSKDAVLDAATQQSMLSGISYGIAAGNGNLFGIAQNACNYSPARVAETITTGATDITDRKAAAPHLATKPNATPVQVRNALVNRATPNVVTNPRHRLAEQAPVRGSLTQHHPCCAAASQGWCHRPVEPQ